MRNEDNVFTHDELVNCSIQEATVDSTDIAPTTSTVHSTYIVPNVRFSILRGSIPSCLYDFLVIVAAVEQLPQCAECSQGAAKNPRAAVDYDSRNES